MSILWYTCISYFYLKYTMTWYNNFEKEKYSSCQICQMKFKLIFIKFLYVSQIIIEKICIYWSNNSNNLNEYCYNIFNVTKWFEAQYSTKVKYKFSFIEHNLW